MAVLSLAWLCAWLAAGRPVADVQPLTNGSGTLSDAAGHRHLRRRHRRHYHIDSDDDEVRPTAKERLEMAQMYNISFVDVWIRRRCRGPGTNTSSPQITAVCHRREHRIHIRLICLGYMPKTLI